MGAAAAIATALVVAGTTAYSVNKQKQMESQAKKQNEEYSNALKQATASVQQAETTTAQEEADAKQRALMMNRTQTVYTTALGNVNETAQTYKKKTLLGG